MVEVEASYNRQEGTALPGGWSSDFLAEKGLDAEASYSDQPLPLLVCLGLVLKLLSPQHELACNGTMDILCPEELVWLVHVQ